MELPSKKGISIFARILIVFLCVNIATSLILIIVAYAFNRLSIERRTKENITQQIESIRDNFENEYRVNLKRSLQSLSLNSTLSDYIGASEVEKLVIGKKVELAFLQTIQTHTTYLSIHFVDAGGNMKINVVGKLRSKSDVNLNKIPTSSSFMPASLAAGIKLFKLLESIPLLLSSGYMEWFMPPREIQIEGPFVDENNSNVFLAGVSKLDLDIGGFGGVIMIRQKLDDFLFGLRDVQFFDENPIWVFDAKGKILQSPEKDGVSFNPTPYLSESFQGSPQLVDVDEGIVAYQDFSVIPGKPFIRVVISIPASFLFEDFAKALRFFSIVLISSILLVLLVALYVSRYLSKPIITLADAASRLAQGDLTTKVQVDTTGEVQILVNSFNQMTEELRETIKSRDASVESLEKEVVERKQMEEQLLQSQKMESLGTLAGGIAHDFNTLIGTIIGYSDIISNELDKKSNIREYLATISRVANRAKTLVKQIGDFSRPKTADSTLINAVTTIGNSMDFIKSILPATIHIKEEYPSQKLVIKANENQINQLIVNLCSNAGDFIKDSQGELKIIVQKIEKIELGAVPGIPGGDYLKLSISDNGHGIEPDRLDRIFDPFYTTKEIGKGSGLGLSIVHSIVKNHNGYIFVDSELGKGTTFIIYLPLISESLA
jgi:signal transduction histidine kinase